MSSLATPTYLSEENKEIIKSFVTIALEELTKERELFRERIKKTKNDLELEPEEKQKQIQMLEGVFSGLLYAREVLERAEAVTIHNIASKL